MSDALPDPFRDDERLIALYRSDPEGAEGRRAAGVLLDRWRNRVYLWCYRMLRDREAALDLTQDCLLRAYRALPRYEARGTVGAWLFTITRNRCLSNLRERPLRRDEGADVEKLVDPGDGVERSLAQREQATRVMKAMADALDPLERQAMWLRAHESMPVDEITRLLGITGTSGARGVLQSARRKLKAELGEDFVERIDS